MTTLLSILGWYALGVLGSGLMNAVSNHERPGRGGLKAMCYGMAIFGPINLIACVLIVFGRGYQGWSWRFSR